MADIGIGGDAQSSALAHPVVEVQAKDLPVFCPNSGMPLWSSHPRVFLDVAGAGEAMCPYCGTRYRLEGDAKAGH